MQRNSDLHANNRSRKQRRRRNPNQSLNPGVNGETREEFAITQIPNPSKMKIVMLKEALPSKMCTVFKYVTNPALSNAGFNTASVSYQINGLFDIDPRVASTACAYFSEWMTLYTRYRVLKVTARLSMFSREGSPSTTPILACIAFHPSGFTANTFTEGYFQVPLSKVKVLATATPFNANLTHMVHEILGDGGLCYQDLAFAGTSSSNPTTGVYCTVALSTASWGGTITNGAYYRLEFDFLTELFDRRNLNV